MTCLHCKARLGGKVELCYFAPSVSAAGCFPNGILIQGTWLLIVFSSSRCNLLVVLFLSNLFKLPVTYMSLEPTNSPPIILQRLQTFLENGVNEAFGIKTVGKVG